MLQTLWTTAPPPDLPSAYGWCITSLPTCNVCCVRWIISSSCNDLDVWSHHFVSWTGEGSYLLSEMVSKAISSSLTHHISHPISCFKLYFANSAVYSAKLCFVLPWHGYIPSFSIGSLFAFRSLVFVWGFSFHCNVRFSFLQFEGHWLCNLALNKGFRFLPCYRLTDMSCCYMVPFLLEESTYNC